MTKTKKPFKRIALSLSLIMMMLWIMLGTSTSVAWFSDTSNTLHNIFHIGDFSLVVSYQQENGTYKVIDATLDPHDIWYTDFINKKVPLVLDVDVDQNNKNLWTVFLNARIEDENGSLLGVCGIGLIMSKLQKVFSDYEKKYVEHFRNWDKRQAAYENGRAESDL